MKIIFFISLALLICGVSTADVLQLKSGELVEGVVVDVGEDFVLLDMGMDIEITYYAEDIENIIYDDNSEFKEAFELKNDEVVEPKKVNPAEEYINIPYVDKTIQRKEKEGQYLERQVDVQKKKIKRQFDKKIAELKKVHPKSAKYIGFFDKYVKKVNVDKLKKMIEFFKSIELSSYFLLYSLFCFPLMMLAKKTRCSMFLSWVPLINILVMLRMAEKSFLWFFLFFIPIVNLFVLVIVWRSIADILQKPSWLGILSIIPGINVIMLWYLALSSNK